jgi:hypothetical protein
MTATDYLVWGVLAHMISDWVLQSDWQARNKAWTGKSELVPARPRDVMPGKVLVEAYPDHRRWVVTQSDHRVCHSATLQLQEQPINECWAGIPDILATHYIERPVREGWRHPASYVHALVHLLALLPVFPWPWALGIAVSHWFVDLRFALAWWRKVFGQDTGPIAQQVALWQDQVVHAAILGAAALGVGGLP